MLLFKYQRHQAVNIDDDDSDEDDPFDLGEQEPSKEQFDQLLGFRAISQLDMDLLRGLYGDERDDDGT